jgi:flagellin
MLAIKNNMMSLNAARNLGISYGRLSTSVERLSSGLRINSAKDDAAGLAVRELIRADVAALNQGVRNANDGVSMLQAAEGALGQIDGILIRMKELVEQANTGTYSSTQTDIMQAEFNELSDEIDRIATSTNFNGKKLLDPTAPIIISLGQGSGTGEVTVTGQSMKCEDLSIGGTKATATGPLVAAVGDEYIGDGDAGETDTIQITFDGETLDINVDGGVSLTTLVDRINAASRAAVSGWNAASIRGDAVHGYQLEMTAWNTGAVAGLAIDADLDGGTHDAVWGADVYSATGSVAVADMVVTDGTGVAIDVTADTASAAIQSAIEAKDNFRAALGYKMNRLEAAAAVLAVQAENLSAAESRISDVDVATEMSEMTRAQVLAQAGIAMLAQANTMPHMALQLLQQ